MQISSAAQSQKSPVKAIKAPTTAHVSRRAIRAATSAALGFGLLVLGGSHTQTLVANGDTRTLTMIHRHTGEEILVTFKRNGRYDQEALNKLNWFLRDWRHDEPTRMDPHLFDIVWEVYRSVGGQSPINVVSAYRSAGTNAMLRRRSRAVAQFSQHINGRAMDFYIPGASMTRVREAGMMLQRGGVGFYPGSANQFVHMDTGSVRHWPKASREYLARLFPDGRTVHIPADGRPMPGFDAALAMVQARGGSASRFYDSRQDEGTSFDDSDDRGGVVRQRSNSMGLFAGLFGGSAARQEAPQRPALAQRPATRAAAQPAEAAPGIPARTAEPVAAPVPQAPAATSVVATAEPRAGTPVQLTPTLAPRMQIAMAPLPLRAPPAATRLRGDGEDAPQVLAAPLPAARPAIAGGADSIAVAALTAPEPLARPEPNRPMPLPEPTQVAQAPMPAARPQAIGGSVVAALPALITTGDQRGRAAPVEASPGMALAFASPTQRVTLPTPTSAGPQPRVAAPAPIVTARQAEPAVVSTPPMPVPAPQLAARHPAPILRTARAPVAVPAMVAPSTEGARGRVVFVRQTTERAAAVATLSTPDPRQQKLIEQPSQIVAMTFSQGAATTVPTQRFVGQAVASLRTVEFARPETDRQARASLIR
ncbi:DUF882 domain-containing protein [Phreatobacter aquaticus]|uniref:Murein endopeptidase K n=1 Tax=Phreatobacter aquaticus TaxID=2570229 RepID=A0A4D7QTE6_9HYPH|nr:DUF882 domain-containing protein [Phreatobacter aquaticus]